jgi:hypothetical protein
MVWPWWIASARGRGFDCSGLRVAGWVADRCLRALFCVARRCSVLVFSLVTPHRCWSAEVPGLHGMQEVWGSNPHSSTGQRYNSKAGTASTAAKYCNSGPQETPRVCSDPGPSSARSAGRVPGLRLLPEAVKLLSCENVLVPSPLDSCHTRLRNRSGRAFPALTLGAFAEGQLGLVAPFAVVISPGRTGSAVGGLEERRDRAAGRAGA